VGVLIKALCADCVSFVTACAGTGPETGRVDPRQGELSQIRYPSHIVSEGDAKHDDPDQYAQATNR